MAIQALAILGKGLEDRIARHCEGDHPRNDENNLEEQWDYLKARTH